MAGEQKIFLGKIAVNWQQEFPFLRSVHLRETPQVPKGCNFICDRYDSSRSVYYFIRFNFSSKRQGEFSIGVAISPSRERSVLDPSMESKPTPTSLGSFGIWQFMHRPRFDWALADVEAGLALLGLETGLPKSPNVWRPSTYDQSIEKIVDEAIDHVNQTLRKSVFSILQIE